MDYLYCQENAESAILTRADYADRISSDWFSAPHWGEQAAIVADGGRGSAWFIDNQDQQWVLRHYRRGGLPAKLSARNYLFTGRQRVRAIGSCQEICRL